MKSTLGKPKSIAAPAIICGLMFYVPYWLPGLRGALVGLFPGLAFRSKRLMAAGFLLGLVADIAFRVFWGVVLDWHADPRFGYNIALAEWLWPVEPSGTHMGCRVSNGVQFVVCLTAYAALIFSLWQFLWPAPRSTEKPSATLRIIFGMPVVVLTMAPIARLLWAVAPLNHWSPFGAASAWDIPYVPFTFVFLAAMPLSFLVLGFLTSRLARFF